MEQLTPGEQILAVLERAPGAVGSGGNCYATNVFPCVGQWYRHLDKGESFVVTGYDERAGTAEIQFFDGDLDEIDSESWAALPIVPTESPEDWTGPVDSAPRDDLGYSETAMKGTDWEAPLQVVPPAAEETWESTADGRDELLKAQDLPNEDLTADSTVARDLALNAHVIDGDLP